MLVKKWMALMLVMTLGVNALSAVDMCPGDGGVMVPCDRTPKFEKRAEKKTLSGQVYKPQLS